MKKILLAAAFSLAALAGSAKTADELRVYINPGHGSWTGGDRFMAVIGHDPYKVQGTDTTAFYESNTNLRKGFGVLEKLRQMGLKFDPTLNQTGERHQIGAARDMSNNIVMSHVKCGPYLEYNYTSNQLNNLIKNILNGRQYDECTEAEKAEIDRWNSYLPQMTLYNRNISEIAEEVEINNFDLFISIHSNANSTGLWSNTNHALFLYRGYDTPKEENGVTLDFQNQCIEIAKKCWPYHLGDKHETWTSYSVAKTNIRGDLNFYNGSSYFMGYKGYLGVLKHGTPGFLSEGYFHTYAPSALRHMNFDVDYVEGYGYAHGIADYFGIEKEKTGTIYGIVRDMHEKFVDKDYAAIPTSDDVYKPLNGVTVQLLDGNGEIVATYTTDNQYNGAFVFNNVEPGTYTVACFADEYEGEPTEVTVEAAAVSYPKVFLESVNYVPPTENYETYPDPLKDTEFVAPDNIEFRQAVVDKEIAELEGATIRRFISYKDRIYVLAMNAENAPVVLVLDAETFEVIARPSIEGCEGTHSPLYDIAVTADGVLIGHNLELCHFSASNVGAGETRGDSNIYYWHNDEAGVPVGNPELWFTSQLSGNWYSAIMGYAMAYDGTFDEGELIVGGRTSAGTAYGFNLFTIIGGQKVSEDIRSRADVSKYMDQKLIGDNITYLYSPIKERCFIANTPKYFLQQIIIGEVNNNGGDNSVSQHWRDDALSTDVLPAAAAGTSFFKYNGTTYLVAPDMNAESACTGIRLINITDGLLKTADVTTVNTTLEGAIAGNVSAAGRVIVKKNDADEIAGADIELYLLRGNKVSRFTTAPEIVPDVVARKEYAYALSSEKAEGESFAISYSLTADVPAAEFLAVPVDGGDEIVVPLTGLAKGENSFVLPGDALDATKDYNWSIRVHGNPSTAAGEYFSEPNGLAVGGSAIAFTDPSTKAFGYTLIAHGANNGMDIYNPAGEKVADRIHKSHAVFNASTTNIYNPFRGDQRDGTAVVASWGDDAAGIVAIDPLDVTAEPFTLYAGTMTGTGAFIYNDVNLGGGHSGFAFVGKGDDTKLYAFSEDHAGTTNTIVRYNIGSAWQITEAPEQIGHGGMLANTNVDVVAYGEGIFVSQVRSEGNNTETVPGFAYIIDDNVLYRSSELVGMNACNSGFAITADGKTAAVAEPKRILICSVKWEENTPSFTIKYEIPTENNNWSTMRFDYAGNLHMFSRSLSGYHAYALVDTDPLVTTPAAASYILKGSSAVDDIAIDNATEAPVRYYNLSGVAVPAENLTPGVYIKVQGDKATKVVVK